MSREIFYTAVPYETGGNTSRASGITTQAEWPALKRALARQGFHIESWYLIDDAPLAAA